MRLKCYYFILLLIFLYPINLFSYNNTKTHKQITDISIQRSDLESYLQTVLGFQNGYKFEINENTITKLIQDGAEREDLGYRGYNHFYNPLTGEGLNDSGFPRVYWGSATGVGKGAECLEYLTVGIPAMLWAMGNGCRMCCDKSNPSEDDNRNEYSWVGQQDAGKLTINSALTESLHSVCQLKMGACNRCPLSC